MARSPGTSLTMPRTAASARCSHHNRDRRHSNAHTQPVVQRLRGLAYLPIRGRPTGCGRRRHRGSNRCVSGVGCGWLVLQQVAELLTQFPVSQKHARHVAPSLRPACCLVQQGMIRYVSTHTTCCAKVGCGSTCLGHAQGFQYTTQRFPQLLRLHHHHSCHNTVTTSPPQGRQQRRHIHTPLRPPRPCPGRRRRDPE